MDFDCQTNCTYILQNFYKLTENYKMKINKWKTYSGFYWRACMEYVRLKPEGTKDCLEDLN